MAHGLEQGVLCLPRPCVYLIDFISTYINAEAKRIWEEHSTGMSGVGRFDSCIVYVDMKI